MKSIIVAALAILVLAFFNNLNTDNAKYETSLELKTAYSFLSFATAFDAYFDAHPSGSGDVTTKIPLPSWLPENNDIKAYISGERGYVFMPTEKGVYSELLALTENSALLGVSDSSTINISDGEITKPSFIPQGYIVYVR